MKKIRLMIADDHPMMREGIRLVLKSFPEYVVVAEAEDGEEAVSLAEQHKPDLVLIDISMPILNGIEATSIMKRNNPDLRVIVLTVHEDEEYVYQVLHAGANGYLLKNAGKKEINAAIKSAMLGEHFFSPGVSKMIIDRFTKRAQSQEPADASGAAAAPKEKQILSNREQEVLRFIAQGYTNRRIAETLFLSIRTVNTHRTNLMQKLGIHDTALLVRYAIEHGYVTS